MARTAESDQFYFEGFDNPTTTPVPDVVFDRFLAKLGEAELKALLYIIRRTFGFKRDRDRISFNQFLNGITTSDGRILDEGAGIRNRTTLSNALKALEAKGIVKSEKGVDERGENVTTVYSLRFRADHQEGVVRSPYHRSTRTVPPVVRQPYPQQTVDRSTVKQQTEINNSNIRNSSRLKKSLPEQEPSKQTAVDSTIRLSPTEREDEEEERSISRNLPSPGSEDQEQTPPFEAPSSRNTRSGLTRIGETLKARAPRGRPLTQATEVDTPSPNGETPPKRPGRSSDSQDSDVDTTNTENPGAERGTRRGRPPDEARQIITSYIADFAPELGDEAKLPVTISRAVNLYKRAGIEIGQFTGLLYEARSRCKEYTATIKKERKSEDGWYAGKNKIPYFFAILEELLGFRESPEHRTDTERRDGDRPQQGRSRGGRYPPPAT